MMFEEIFANINFVSEVQVMGGLRRLKSKTADLASLMYAQVIRGDPEFSAPYNQLSFQLGLKDYTSHSLTLSLKFDNPESVSLGAKDKRDIALITFVEPDLFISAVSGQSMNLGDND